MQNVKLNLCKKSFFLHRMHYRLALKFAYLFIFFFWWGGGCNSLFSLRVNIYCFVVVVIVVSFVPEYW